MSNRLAGPTNIGFGNMVAAGRIVAMVKSDSAPVKRMIQDARERKMLIDATQGRRTRAVIVADSGHVILSAILPETIAARLTSEGVPSQDGPAQQDDLVLSGLGGSGGSE